jgi:hypothetical protein
MHPGIVGLINALAGKRRLYQGYHRFAASRPIPHFPHVETANAALSLFNTRQQKELCRP